MGIVQGVGLEEALPPGDAVISTRSFRVSWGGGGGAGAQHWQGCPLVSEVAHITSSHT